MESSHDSGTLQKRAEQYLHDLLQGCPAIEIPGRIARLAAAAPQDNPVRELFRAADTLAPLAPLYANGGNAQQLKPHKSKFSLRFSRNKDKAKAGSSSSQVEKGQQEYLNVFQADVKFNATDLETGQPNLQSSGLSSARPDSAAKLKASSTVASYNCIFCHTDYTTKGTCKRHLEEIHVAKRYFRCILCSQKFATAPEARKHCSTCGVGLVGYKTEIPEEHKVYSSEFVSHEIFETQQGYVTHLLDLSVVTNESRPVRSWHRKLRNLLEQPVCESTLRRLSLRLFASMDGWRNVRWEHERIKRAVKELEHGVLDHELDPNDMLKLRRIEKFLEDLFSDWAMSTTVIAESPIHEKAVPLLMVEAQAGMREGSDATLRHVGPTPKRPLSFESSTVAPIRQPPGPPTPGLHAAQHQQQHHYHHYQHAPPRINTLNSIPDMQHLSYNTDAPSHEAAYAAQEAEQPIMFWSLQDQQPPPYEGAFPQAALSQPAYSAGMLPDQSFAGSGFSNDLLSFAGLSGF